MNMMKRFAMNFFLLVVFAGWNISLVAQQFHYYNVDEADITLLSSWVSNPDGTGNHPENFTTDSSYFHVYSSVTLQGNLTITGSDSRVIVGDSLTNVELSLAPFTQLNATVDLKRRAGLAILSNSYPEFGVFEDGSSVSFAFSGSKLIPYHDYYNLQILGVNPVFDDQGGDIFIRGNLNIQGTANFPDARGNAEYNFVFNGSGDQEVSSDGNVVRSYNMTFEKPSGRFTFGDNTVISADNELVFMLDQPVLFEDNGINIYAGNSVTIGGQGNYNFSGTLVLAGNQTGIVNGAGTGNQFAIHDGNNGAIVTSLHNINISAPNTGGQFTFAGASGNVLTITGDFRVDEQADGLVNFQENEVKIHGDFIIEEGFAGEVADIKKLTILNELNEDQGMTIPVPVNIEEMEIFNNVLLTGQIGITSLLHLSSGSILDAGNSSLVTLAMDATITGYDDQNTIETALGYQVANTETNEFTFPLSVNGLYIPLSFSVTHTNDEAGIYIARLFTDNLPALSLPVDLEQVYADFFFQLQVENNPAISDITVGIPFDASVPDLNEELLRVAGSETDSWINLGGNATDGVVYSDVFFDQTSYLALAKYLPSTTKQITSFRFENIDPSVEGVIDEQEKTINLLVPPATDVTALVPSIEHTGVSVSPASGLAQDFSSDVVYTVTAEDNSTSAYTVSVEVEVPVFSLTLVSMPEEGGTVSGEGTFEEGEQITVSAQPVGEYIFVHWMDNHAVVSGQAEFTYTMPAADVTLTAVFELPVNEPPVVENTPGFQQTIEQGDEIVLDISDVFSDPEQDDLTLEVVSSQPGIVSSQINADLLAITPLMRGESTLTLSADDGTNDPVSTSFRVLVYPQPLQVASPPENILDAWDAATPEYTYPEHMIFLQSDQTDPGVDAPLLFAYHVPQNDYHQDDQDQIGFPYALTQGTRISGLGNDGISLVNDNSARDLGGVLMALNTTGFNFIDQSLALGFTLENLASHTGTVGIRLQYRLDVAQPFTDWMHNGEPVTYFFGEGHEQGLLEEVVPFSPELATETEHLQILFRYYFVDGDAGPRPEVRLDDVFLTLQTSVHSFEEEQIQIFANEHGIVVQQDEPGKGVLEIYNLAGQQLFAKSLKNIDRQILPFRPEAGIYLVQISQNQKRNVVRKIVVR